MSSYGPVARSVTLVTSISQSVLCYLDIRCSCMKQPSVHSVCMYTLSVCVQGSDHLTVTWKVADATLQHVDVREEGKENVFSLGRSLWIGNEVCLSHRFSLCRLYASLSVDSMPLCLSRNARLSE